MLTLLYFATSGQMLSEKHCIVPNNATICLHLGDINVQSHFNKIHSLKDTDQDQYMTAMENISSIVLYPNQQFCDIELNPWTVFYEYNKSLPMMLFAQTPVPQQMTTEIFNASITKLKTDVETQSIVLYVLKHANNDNTKHGIIQNHINLNTKYDELYFSIVKLFINMCCVLKNRLKNMMKMCIKMFPIIQSLTSFSDFFEIRKMIELCTEHDVEDVIFSEHHIINFTIHYFQSFETTNKTCVYRILPEYEDIIYDCDKSSFSYYSFVSYCVTNEIISSYSDKFSTSHTHNDGYSLVIMHMSVIRRMLYYDCFTPITTVDTSFDFLLRDFNDELNALPIYYFKLVMLETVRIVNNTQLQNDFVKYLIKKDITKHYYLSTIFDFMKTLQPNEMNVLHFSLYNTDVATNPLCYKHTQIIPQHLLTHKFTSITELLNILSKYFNNNLSSIMNMWNNNTYDMYYDDGKLTMGRDTVTIVKNNNSYTYSLRSSDLKIIKQYICSMYNLIFPDTHTVTKIPICSNIHENQHVHYFVSFIIMIILFYRNNSFVSDVLKNVHGIITAKSLHDNKHDINIFIHMHKVIHYLYVV